MYRPFFLYRPPTTGGQSLDTIPVLSCLLSGRLGGVNSDTPAAASIMASIMGPPARAVGGTGLMPGSARRKVRKKRGEKDRRGEGRREGRIDGGREGRKQGRKKAWVGVGQRVCRHGAGNTRNIICVWQAPGGKRTLIKHNRFCPTSITPTLAQKKKKNT